MKPIAPGPKLIQRIYATESGRLALALDHLLYRHIDEEKRVSFPCEIELSAKDGAAGQETLNTKRLLDDARHLLERIAFNEVTES